MISRIYADNFRCLVNFDLKLSRLNVLLGTNGSGKSTVFEVLQRLQSFVLGDCRVGDAFPHNSLTRWQSRREQRFELDIRLPEWELTYVIVIEHLEGSLRSRVKEERLTEGGGTVLFHRQLDTVTLYRDDGSEGPKYPFDWEIPALVTIQSRHDNTKLTAFKEQMQNLVIASIKPAAMQRLSESEATKLTAGMENFISWYRRVSQENMGSMVELFTELKDVLTGFSSFSFRDHGQDAKSLSVLFGNGETNAKPSRYDFAELSDGQRVLIALYALLHASSERYLCLFLDEPDNYVALAEIQPWLMQLNDLCGERFDQAVLISHHPEIIDQIGVSDGIMLTRDAEAPCRIQAGTPSDEDDGLKLSEIIARGWEG